MSRLRKKKKVASALQYTMDPKKLWVFNKKKRRNNNKRREKREKKKGCI